MTFLTDEGKWKGWYACDKCRATNGLFDFCCWYCKTPAGLWKWIRPANLEGKDMTSPTQAQIDAAELAKWINELKWKSVDKDNMEYEVRMTCYVRDALLSFAALTAAAGVEDWEKEARFLQRELERAVLRHRIELVATIERCAQVAETCDFNSDGNDGTRRASIADAIRALKEKP